MTEDNNNTPDSVQLQLGQMNFNFGKIHRNLPVATLTELAIQRNEGILSITGALAVNTGKFTGRSPEVRYIVDDDTTHDLVNWGKVNHPLLPEKFEGIFNRMRQHISGREFFIFDGFVGADQETRLPIRVLTDSVWHSIFATQIFIRPHSREIQKAFFTVMNFLLPLKGVFPMHCSANVGGNGDTALFFGLSGTGKTTLSADAQRALVGNDEHGWSDKKVFNFEGGCYAKCINLRKENEPQIWNAIKFGAVMENVVIDDKSRKPDFDDSRLTENTRVVYPLDYIPGAVVPSIAEHPNVIIFLTADAFGVMPPIAKLSKERAMYHFISGYTSKLAGTERGITEPKETFSQCFGGPFMPLHAQTYAKLLGGKMDDHGTRVYLINTGWTGGPYGIGKRMNLSHTRAMVTAALTGEIEKVPVRHH